MSNEDADDDELFGIVKSNNMSTSTLIMIKSIKYKKWLNSCINNIKNKQKPATVKYPKDKNPFVMFCRKNTHLADMNIKNIKYYALVHFSGIIDYDLLFVSSENISLINYKNTINKNIYDKLIKWKKLFNMNVSAVYANLVRLKYKKLQINVMSGYMKNGGLELEKAFYECYDPVFVNCPLVGEDPDPGEWIDALLKDSKNMEIIHFTDYDGIYNFGNGPNKIIRLKYGIGEDAE